MHCRSKTRRCVIGKRETFSLYTCDQLLRISFQVSFRAEMLREKTRSKGGWRAAETTGLAFTQSSRVDVELVEIICVKVRPVSSATLDYTRLLVASATGVDLLSSSVKLSCVNVRLQSRYRHHIITDIIVHHSAAYPAGHKGMYPAQIAKIGFN